MPEKVKEGGNKGGDVGPSGGTKDAIDGLRFEAGLNELHFWEDLQGTAGGIKFNGEGDQIKKHDRTPTRHHDGEVGLGLEPAKTGEKTKEGEPGDNLAGKSGGTDGGHTPLQGTVGNFVLNGVAAFVGGDAEGSGRVALKVLG